MMTTLYCYLHYLQSDDDYTVLLHYLQSDDDYTVLLLTLLTVWWWLHCTVTYTTYGLMMTTLYCYLHYLRPNDDYTVLLLTLLTV